MPDLAAMRSDVGRFSQEVGWPLKPWQAEALRLEARTTAIVAPRQSGKSRSLAVLAAWWAFRRRGQLVLVVSAGEEAARRLLGEVRAIVNGSPLLSASVVDEQAGLLTLSNGSAIRSVPASERQVRGWTVDLLLADEAALLAGDLLLGAAVPTTAARPEARIVLASSATVASGAFFDAVVRGEQGSEHTRTFRWALTDCEWISPSVIAAARESMTEARFAAEYEGVFASGADALFTRAVLERATADYMPEALSELAGPARVTAGCDWGATVDHSAFVAIGRLALPGERVFAVRTAHRWPAGTPLAAVIEDIARSPAHLDQITSETNGLGMPCTQQLFTRLAQRAADAGGGRRQGAMLVDAQDLDRELGRRQAPAPLPVFETQKIPRHTSAEMKAATYSALRLLIDQGHLLLPAAAEDLLRELLLLRVDLSPTGTERIEASSGHDDLADALMLATTPYKPRETGRWRCWIADLARARLPEATPGALPAGALVTAGDGRQIPRRPMWQSVRGPESTLPAGYTPAAPTSPWLTDVREHVAAALQKPDRPEEVTHAR